MRLVKVRLRFSLSFRAYFPLLAFDDDLLCVGLYRTASHDHVQELRLA